MRDLASSNDSLTDKVGWVNVNPKTLQSKAYENVFALGDCESLVNEKFSSYGKLRLKCGFLRLKLTKCQDSSSDFKSIQSG